MKEEEIFSAEELSELESLNVFGGIAPDGLDVANTNCTCTYVYCSTIPCSQTSLGCGANISGCTSNGTKCN